MNSDESAERTDRIEEFDASAEDIVVVAINDREYEFLREDMPELKEFFEDLEIEREE